MEKVEVNGPGTHPVYQFLKLGRVGFFVHFFSLEKKNSSKLQYSICRTIDVGRNFLSYGVPRININVDNQLTVVASSFKASTLLESLAGC